EGIRSRASRWASMLRFEGRILRPLLEEIREGRIEMTQRWLERDGTAFGKKGVLRLLFPVGEVRGGQGRADGLLLLPPGRSAKCQGRIVNRAGATEGLRELSGLRIRREESIFECLLDDHRDSFRHTGKDDKCCQSWAKRRRCAHSSPSKLARWMEYSFADLDKGQLTRFLGQIPADLRIHWHLLACTRISNGLQPHRECIFQHQIQSFGISFRHKLGTSQLRNQIK